MKRFITIICVFAASCSKDITETNLNFPLLNPVKPDANAGTWKTILPLNPADFAPANPPAVQDAAFKAQLDQIVTLQRQISKADQQNLDY